MTSAFTCPWFPPPSETYLPASQVASAISRQLWKVKKLEFLHNSTNSCTIPRVEACITVFERRSHLGPAAEGRLGPSDDDDDDDMRKSVKGGLMARGSAQS